jgi:hypothetical protein
VQGIDLPKRISPIRIAFYDFETTQEDEIAIDVLEHHVAYISLRWTCSTCEDNGKDPNCMICTPACQLSPETRSKSWSWYTTSDPIFDFVTFLLVEFDSKNETILWAHNGGKFDAHFVLNTLYRMKFQPSVIMTGLKIYDITVQMKGRSKLHFRDSYLIMQTALDNLKKTFSLDVEEKMFFPYLFCRRQNKEIELPHLPPMKDYIPSTMKPEKYCKFMVL